MRIEQEKTGSAREMQAFEQAKLKTERKLCAKHLYDENIILIENLCRSFKVEMTNVSDYLFLDLKKNVFRFTSDLKEILGKITSFSKLVAYCGDDGLRMIEELSNCREDAVAKVTRFSNELDDLIRERDVTEEKLKSLVSFKIEIPKFKGHESDMDIYTF